MTISSSVSKTPTYACNGSTTSFPYGFKILAASDLAVILEGVDGFQTILTLGTDYTLSGIGSDLGGTISTVTVYPTGSKLIGVRRPSFLQSVDLQNQGAFFAQVIEEALDLAAMRDQNLQAELVNVIRAPDTETVSMVLPSAALRANKYLLFDANGQPTYVDSQIDERYYGALSADPATRPDGSARQGGDAYFNTTSLGFRVYSGFGWQAAIPPAALTLVNFTEVAASAKTTFTISGGYTLGAAFAYLNGVLLAPDEVTLSNGTTAVLASACAIGDEFRLIAYSAFSVADVLSRSSNLNDLSDIPTARTNLGLGAASTPTFTAIRAADHFDAAGGNTARINGAIPVARSGDNLTGGMTATALAADTMSTGTYTATPSGGNVKAITNTGAFTLAAPTVAGVYTMIIEVTNGTGAGAITMTGFARVGGELFTTTLGNKFQIFIAKTLNGVTANVVAMQ